MTRRRKPRRRPSWLWHVHVVPLVASLTGGAMAAPCTLKDLPGGTVSEVVDGDTARLEDGREVRFVGLQAPKLALGRKGFTPWPLAEKAKAAAEALLLGRKVALKVGGRQMDRHGRVLAHLYLTEGPEEARWVQAELLRQGWARVYSFADNRACTSEMLALEAEARTAGRGIWVHPFYAVREAQDLEKLEGLTNSYQLIEGQVLRVARVRSRIYVNFGEDWRKDFTAVVHGRDSRAFGMEEPVPAALAALEGKRVRLRGWLRQRNGPEIALTHPEAVEIIEEKDTQTYPRPLEGALE
ncbi:thermonuclease family protein [Tepidicaulis sp. LMO-SS28]|uniref:thermonuclease family protein n=1 Tax=Tepidicaulis sp. LMO-SS28 TaxID=3447455 RepID=UPI003EE1F89C